MLYSDASSKFIKVKHIKTFFYRKRASTKRIISLMHNLAATVDTQTVLLKLLTVSLYNMVQIGAVLTLH